MYFVHKHKHRQSDCDVTMLPQKPLLGNDNWYYWNVIEDQTNVLENYLERVFQIKDKRENLRFI